MPKTDFSTSRHSENWETTPPANHMAQRPMGCRAIAVVTRPRSAITMATWTVQNAICAPSRRKRESTPLFTAALPARLHRRDRRAAAFSVPNKRYAMVPA